MVPVWYVRIWTIRVRTRASDGEGLTWGGAELTAPLHKSVRFDMSCFSVSQVCMSCTAGIYRYAIPAS